MAYVNTKAKHRSLDKFAHTIISIFVAIPILLIGGGFALLIAILDQEENKQKKPKPKDLSTHQASEEKHNISSTLTSTTSLSISLKEACEPQTAINNLKEMQNP